MDHDPSESRPSSPLTFSSPTDINITSSPPISVHSTDTDQISNTTNSTIRDLIDDTQSTNTHRFLNMSQSVDIQTTPRYQLYHWGTFMHGE
ncbi:hypothetical protein CROQUDRAFT_98278 [Cronartium quercuum f. sp. fusiforme G11]|uniref:Uncharacterized protein n=1 Tax=Cronartium quercuum f. sp. fusiforme G11 TaxID=708437 RepID=A0A9P6NA70_9BASI|nr:hypothetical protein CROQUDRAFT_98278 [Cronartium quercuum f. sp. fusiforme G11]